MVTIYHAAERAALLLVVPHVPDLFDCMVQWFEEFSVASGRDPEMAMVEAARCVLQQRIDNVVPPLPSSASSTAWKIPKTKIVDWRRS